MYRNSVTEFGARSVFLTGPNLAIHVSPVVARDLTAIWISDGAQQHPWWAVLK